jgi:hypothetical protein
MIPEKWKNGFRRGDGMIIALIIYVLVSFIMIGIGVSQLKSKVPVGFYTGEKAPDVEDIADVPAWNRKHGVMWIVYGAVILLSWVVGFLVDEGFWQGFALIAGVCLPLIFMIMYHSVLVKRYKK